MKKIITIMIGCSMALAASAVAQQDNAEATPHKKKQHENAAQAAPEGQPPARQQAERPNAMPHKGMKSPEQRAERRNARAERQGAQPDAPKGHAKAQAAESAAANPVATERMDKHRKDRETKAAMANESATAATAPDANAQPGKNRNGRKAKAQMNTEATAPANGNVSAQTETAPQANQPKQGNRKMKGQAKPVDVQAIKAQHANFKAQPKPQQVPAVTFSQSNRISGADQWHGQQYTVFRSYQPQMHDQAFYHSHYSRVELIGGGYYYFNGGYWYPAWGYQPTAQYYVYDGPIYAGHSAERLDRVIADVQAVLQAQGYYKGEVDGLLGPLTRQALTGYQADHGMYTTGTIDEPTLNSLGMS